MGTFILPRKLLKRVNKVYDTFTRVYEDFLQGCVGKMSLHGRENQLRLAEVERVIGGLRCRRKLVVCLFLRRFQCRDLLV